MPRMIVYTQGPVSYLMMQTCSAISFEIIAKNIVNFAIIGRNLINKEISVRFKIVYIMENQEAGS